MLAIERRTGILAELQLEKSVLVSDLSKKYNVTEETIRRDLEKLAKDGLAKKTYGGAVLVENISAEVSYKIRAKTNKEQKTEIARKISELIEPGENIMLDASSTCVLIAKKLKDKKKLTIITNSVEILLEYADSKNANVISTGGALRESSLSLVGHDAERLIERFTVDKAIISCKGLDLEKGITESNVAEMEIKKAMAGNAKQVVLAVDSSKFNKLSFIKLLELQKIDMIVTDTMPPPEWVEILKKNNIELLK